MSHATVMVVLENGEDIEDGVSTQMAPFDENGEWFAEGSRWDWYVIGGRWDGMFSETNERTAGWLKKNWKDDFVCYAFLRDKQWNERDRMGWFGVSAATECEVKAPKKEVRRCVTKGLNGARVISWKEDYEAWKPQFFKRFIERLPDEARCIVVDFHV